MPADTLPAGSSGPSDQPVGKGDYVVKQGDCMESIAARHGHFWQTIWDHPDNAELKNTRKDPNILLEGDRVTIPDLREKEEACATEATHRFRRKGVPSRFRLRLLDDDQPRANVEYILDIDGELIEGKTDGEGWIDQPISPDAKQVTVMIEGEEDLEFRFGQIDPIDTLSGVKSRLRNLGYHCGPRNGELTPETRLAIEAFQRKHDLEVTGEPDQALQEKLKEVHGS